MKQLTLRELDDLVDAWHAMPEEEHKARGNPSIYEFTGLSQEDYADFIHGVDRLYTVK